MADIADTANDQAQMTLESHLAVRRKAARPDPQGACLAPRCGEEFTDEKRLFCNEKCANDYAKHTANK